MRIKQIQEMMAEINADPLTMSQHRLKQSSSGRGIKKSASEKANWAASRLALLADPVRRKKLSKNMSKGRRRTHNSWSEDEKRLYREAIARFRANRTVAQLAEEYGIKIQMMRRYLSGQCLDELE